MMPPGPKFKFPVPEQELSFLVPSGASLNHVDFLRILLQILHLLPLREVCQAKKTANIASKAILFMEVNRFMLKKDRAREH